MRRKHRPTILTDERDPLELKLVTFGIPPTTCSLKDRPAVFGECMECEYQRGARGLGIMCAHRFGIDPTYVDGQLTQLRGDDILPI